MSLRGDVVLVDFPYSDGSGSKIRPGVVVQNDADNQRLQNTVVAMVTGNVSHANRSSAPFGLPDR
jgi:mRNA interferase MazF